MNLSKKLTAEFLGTFWLVLGGCGSAADSCHQGQPTRGHRRFFAPVVAARLKHYPETVEETVEPDLFTVDGAITSDISVTI